MLFKLPKHTNILTTTPLYYAGGVGDKENKKTVAPSTSLFSASVPPGAFDTFILEEIKNSPIALVSTVYYVHKSMSITQTNMSILAEEIQQNTSAQTYINNVQSQFQYDTIPSDTLYKSDGSPNNDISASLLQDLQSKNQAMGSVRQSLQNQIGTLNNSAQVVSSNINTSNNIIQQSLQVGQALLQTFSQIVSLIVNI